LNYARLRCASARQARHTAANLNRPLSSRSPEAKADATDPSTKAWQS